MGAVSYASSKSRHIDSRKQLNNPNTLCGISDMARARSIAWLREPCGHNLLPCDQLSNSRWVVAPQIGLVVVVNKSSYPYNSQI